MRQHYLKHTNHLTDLYCMLFHRQISSLFRAQGAATSDLAQHFKIGNSEKKGGKQDVRKHRLAPHQESFMLGYENWNISTQGADLDRIHHRLLCWCPFLCGCLRYKKLQWRFQKHGLLTDSIKDIMLPSEKKKTYCFKNLFWRIRIIFRKMNTYSVHSLINFHVKPGQQEEHLDQNKL